MQALDLKIPTILIVILLPSRDIFVNGEPIPKQFDYFTLAMQWPGTVCELELVAHCPNYWTIHGLWPSKYDGFGPLNCNGELLETDVEGINNLKEMWPDLVNEKNFDFWKTQWKRHGSCAANMFKANDYFSRAVDLAGRFNIRTILENNQLNLGNRYEIWKIRDALFAVTGHHSKVKVKKCTKKLFEIEICFDKNNFNVIHCKDDSALYPHVQQPNQQQLQQPQPLIQTNEDQCQLLSNGQTQINFIAPVLQPIIILLTQLLFF